MIVRVPIWPEDKPRVKALQEWLSSRRGHAVDEPELVEWLLDLAEEHPEWLIELASGP